MNDERTGPGQAGRPRLEWPMAPGVPGSASAREARTIVGLSADASDSEFVGASPSDGRDALVSAARRRLEPVLAAHGTESRASWLVDHELKSALARLLVSVPPPRSGTGTQAPAPVPAGAATAVPAARPSDLPARLDLHLAVALFLRRAPVGRALLGLSMQARTLTPVRHSELGVIEDDTAGGDPSELLADRAHGRVRRRSRARVIAATIAVLSAIGLVIEIAYVPVHLQRSRAKQQAAAGGSGSAPSPPPSAAPGRRPEPASQPQASASDGIRRTADGASDAAIGATASGPAASGAPLPARSAPIPAPMLPADEHVGVPQLPPAPARESMDPTLRQRLDELAAQWTERLRTSVDANRAAQSLEPGPMRWLAQARLLERLIALDDIAQLLIDARADEAGSLIDVMPLPCVMVAPSADRGAETSGRDDGRLATDLSRAGGGGESRLAVLRAYRSLPVAPGRADSRVLVSEAIGGPSRNARALALAILLERGPTSVALLEAVHARAAELCATPAGRAVVEQLAGEVPGGAPLGAQALRARLARRILEGRGAPTHLIDATADEVAAMLDRMARRADPQVMPADMESSIATLARAASRDALPARAEGASGPLQRMVASLVALEGARVVRNHRRLPDERLRVDAASAAASSRVLAADSALGQAIEVAIGMLAQDCIALGMQELPQAALSSALWTSGEAVSSNPLEWPEPAAEALARWPEAARALQAADGGAQDGDALVRMAEDVQEGSQDADDRSIAARLYARAAIVGGEATAASAARGIASLIPSDSSAHSAERHRWESIASQYAMADAAMRGRSRSQRRPGAVANIDADASARAALADAIALCIAGSGRQAIHRLQSPTVRALGQRLSGALPGGISGLEALCEGRTPSSPPLEPHITDQLLGVEAALRDARSMRWSDDLALRRGLPLVSVDASSEAARVRLFTPAPASGPR